MSASSLRRKRPVVLPSEEERENGDVFPVMGDDGEVRWYRRKTGEPVDAPLPKEKYRPYNKHDAELIGQCLARGMSVGESLSHCGVPRSTYIMWRREVPEFGSMVEGARVLRAEEVHESVGEEIAAASDKVRIGDEDIDSMTTVELKEYTARVRAKKELLNVLGKHQEIKQKFTKDDAPGRFGIHRQVIDTEGNKMLEASLDIPDNISTLLKDTHIPEVLPDGGFSIKGLPDAQESCDNGVDGTVKEQVQGESPIPKNP